jgi:hypothetical protein
MGQNNPVRPNGTRRAVLFELIDRDSILFQAAWRALAITDSVAVCALQ